MSAIAVIAHSGKSVEGGLPELRRALAGHGVTDPLWVEVPKSKKAPKRRAGVLRKGADHFFVWGGDGMAQRCIDTLAGTGATIAHRPGRYRQPARHEPRHPHGHRAAVAIGLQGRVRTIDVVTMNGERFAVMAGAGFDADMIADADGGLKDRLGRAAYLWTGTKSIRAEPFEARIRVDGAPWYRGPASCILVGNVGSLFGGVRMFPDAEPDDGLVDLAVITADGVGQWAETVGRTLAGRSQRSAHVRTTKAHQVKVKLDRKVLYELDGGARTKVKAYRLQVEPRAIGVRVPGRPEMETEST